MSGAVKKKSSPAEFVRQVRQEGAKVTWTTWKETWITSVMVFIMVILAALFFLAVDGVISWVIRQLLRVFG